MNDLESHFRWAIYIDYGVSPEQLAQNVRTYVSDTMAYFNNTGLGKVRESANNRKIKLTNDATCQRIGLNVTVNPMAKWIKENLSDFEQFKTPANTPGNVKGIAFAQ